MDQEKVKHGLPKIDLKLTREPDCVGGVCNFGPSELKTNSGRLKDYSDSTIISFLSPWKYWDGDQGAPLGWEEKEFPDQQWVVGTAPLGYMFEEEGTHVRAAERIKIPKRLYFRKEFFLDETLATSGEIRLAIHRVGGVVVFLNGREVFRDNAPENISDEQMAHWTPSQTQRFPLQCSPNYGFFAKGSNTVAVEMRPWYRRICFDMAVIRGEEVLRPPTRQQVQKSLVRVGEPAPNLEWIAARTRQMHSIQELRGKNIIIEFMGAYCAPCWSMVPKLQAWASELRGLNVFVLSISMNSTIADIESVLSRHPDLFPDIQFGAEMSGADLFATTSYKEWGIRGTPTMVLIDESGKVQASCVGTELDSHKEFRGQVAQAGIQLPDTRNVPELLYKVDAEQEVQLRMVEKTHLDGSGLLCSV